MSGDPSLSQRLSSLVLENLGLKLFSLLVSVGLFTVVHGSEAGQRSLYVPVVAMMPPESSGKLLVGEIPDKIKVTLSGSRSVLNSIDSVDAVQVDLTDARSYYYFDPQSFGLPAGINIEVTPPTLQLEWEDRAERKLPVRVQLGGTADPSLELVGNVTVTPARLTVRGPRPTVEAMRELPTEAISLTDLGPGTYRRRATLLPVPKNVNLIDAGAECVVEFTLEARREQRRLKRLAVAALGVGTAVTVRPQHVDVIVSAPQSALEDIDPEHVVPVVDLTDVEIGTGTTSVPVKLRGVDDSVHIVRIEPAEVLVRAR